MEKYIYFSDHIFSKGKKDIYDKEENRIGSLDLKSAFTSSVNVENKKGEVVIEGKFPSFSNKWAVSLSDGNELGQVKSSLSFFTKRYKYKTSTEQYEIESPALSREYIIYDKYKKEAATFKKVNGLFEAAAFELRNNSDSLLTEELIAVVMGVNAIQKRRNNAASPAT
ncbi:hypothetical protein [Halobacillus massiliensis]|uniref:hypothetical protein n=1 Tax=Halobacillus massiliensis TaxID=1926286 RepID=UPI0009E54516|nr:hypothetical protein [Halobacillus massiliensis]